MERHKDTLNMTQYIMYQIIKNNYINRFHIHIFASSKWRGTYHWWVILGHSSLCTHVHLHCAAWRAAGGRRRAWVSFQRTTWLCQSILHIQLHLIIMNIMNNSSLPLIFITNLRLPSLQLPVKQLNDNFSQEWGLIISCPMMMKVK